MTYRTSAQRDASPVPLPPALSRAFDDQASRSLRVGAIRVAILVPIFALAHFVHHWALWVVFGIATFLQLVPAIMLFAWVRPRARKLQRRLETDASRIVWIHTEREERSKLHRIELHDRAGDAETIFTTESLARAGVDAMRPLGVTITTTAEERAAAEPRMRLAGKLVKLDEESAAAEPPKLRAERANVEAFLAAWDARVERDGGASIAADVEARVDKALHYYHASRLAARGPGVESPPEYFTADITKLLVELSELASSPRV